MFGFFIADIVVTGIAAWYLTCACGHVHRGVVEAAVAWALSFVTLVTGAGVILGITGGFGEIGFLALHSATFLAFAVRRRKASPSDWSVFCGIIEQTRVFFIKKSSDRLIAVALSAALLSLTIIAALAQPAIIDAVTYHLPRAAHWLQDGRIQMIATSDERLNFVAGVSEIMTAWLLGCTRDGFRFVILAQSIGGIMAVGATVGMARLTGLNRGPSLLAGGLLLGMANFVGQFTAAQTDLFTAGVFAAAVYLWLVALQNGTTSVIGTVGAGLAVGAKGTLFYMFPTAVLWIIWLSLRNRISWAQVRRTALAGALGVALFPLAGILRNWHAYGNLLGPPQWVDKHHKGFDSMSGQLHKIYWNLTSSLAQNCTPMSQPIGFQEVSRVIGRGLIKLLPENDIYIMDGMERKPMLAKLMRSALPDSDIVAFGVVSFILFLGGSGIAMAHWRRQTNHLVLLWAAGVVCYFLFFHTMQQWHPYAFRYFVLLAPWIGIVSAWCVEQLPRRGRAIIWILLMAATTDVAWRVTANINQSGWETVARPEETPGYYFTRAWREWSQSFGDKGRPITLALFGEPPVTGFYRQWPPREVRYKMHSDENAATAEELLHDVPGWVIVPASRFMGREGNVAAETWLFKGSETNIYSLAAYRLLQEGEKPKPIVYRNRRLQAENVVTYDLLVKAPPPGQTVGVRLSNPGHRDRAFRWSTPLAKGENMIPAGKTLAMSMPLTANRIEQLIVVIELAGDTASPTLTVLH